MLRTTVCMHEYSVDRSKLRLMSDIAGFGTEICSWSRVFELEVELPG